MKTRPFTLSFTQQEPISETAIAAAVSVLRSGRLHRYNVVEGELSQAALLEREFAAFQASRYCLACASGGYALQLALRAIELAAGEYVLTNAFTLAPVPGAIVAAGGRPLLVETTADLTPDLDDLERKALASKARVLLLSHMRGHMPDMDAVMALVSRHGLVLIEDCAHTMGASWAGRKSGTFGHLACFSTQTYKHLNSGEGGLLTTDDDTLAARATVMSGSYMIYERHGTVPALPAVEGVRLRMPNLSGRMDNLRAAILRPQLEELDRNVERWNERYAVLAERLGACNAVHMPQRPPQERYVGSSIQFLVPDMDAAQASAFVAACAGQGVELKWFGRGEPLAFTSTHHHWQFVEGQSLPQTDRILAGLFDMRIPLTFSPADCAHIADIILDAIAGRENA